MAASLAWKKCRVEHQGKTGEKFVENIRFARDGVMFITLNVPGSNNNKVVDEKDCSNKSARTGMQCAADNAEYAERDAANIGWMHDAFEKAKAEKDAGLMIVLQADLGFDIPETGSRRKPVAGEERLCRVSRCGDQGDQGL
jgi:hypothetical protein